ncbi:MAG: iron-containing alcohol dehydrogenase family protein [Brumimicrobium sp.]|nr:iron-containing alcohol dehydrogenase family protein [Brumimicrobium sp.]
MIYRQQSYLPIIFQVDEGIIYDISEYLKRNMLLFNKVLVVSGKSFSKKYAEEIARRNQWQLYELADNTEADIEQLKQKAIQENIELFVSVGGGKVIDAVKRVSLLIQVNNLAVPTIISNDGLISPISVIKNKFGKTDSLPGMMPMGVVIDIDIIKDSPIKFIRSAAGDILSNVSATNDWILAFQNSKEKMNDIAFHLSKSAANSLIHFDEINLKSKPFLRLVVQGQINSGIAMSLAGTSRPCSGSEHLISHAIDHLDYGKNTLHGTQVASISLFTLYLQDKLEEKHIIYAKKSEIPLDFTDLTIDLSENLFCKLIDTAREMRPGRFTVLDCFSTPEIYRKLLAFKQFIAIK